jgi:phospholipase C
VIAIVCKAQFMARFPPRFSRTLPALAPDQTGTGAVPVNLTNLARELNRWTPAVSPMITAADSTPQPGMASSAGAWARTRTRSSASRPLI